MVQNFSRCLENVAFGNASRTICEIFWSRSLNVSVSISERLYSKIFRGEASIEVSCCADSEPSTTNHSYKVLQKDF